MKFALTITCLLGLSFGLPVEQSKKTESYRGHKIFSVIAKQASDVELLRQLETNDIELDFWIEPTLGRRTDFRVKPNDLGRIKATLKRANIDWEILSEDIQESIDEEKRLNQAARSSTDPLDFLKKHLTFSEIKAVLENFQSSYETVSVSDYGQTVGKNPLKQVKVAKTDGEKRPAIWVESLAHAREWVTGSVVLNIIKQLASGANNKAVEMLNSFDWYFTPVLNPDGYEYSHTTERLWRKNRVQNNFWCYGVDLNRNWDAYWREEGTSTNPCSDIYGGPSAFSEPETKSLRDAVARTPDVKAFFSFHSYSELLLLPFGHGQYDAPNLQVLTEMAEKAMEEQVYVDGKYYKIGVPKDILYKASGGAYDYMMMGGNIPYAFTYELRPDGNANNGFVLNPDQIIPTCNETFASLWSFSMQIRDRLS